MINVRDTIVTAVVTLVANNVVACIWKAASSSRAATTLKGKLVAAVKKENLKLGADVLSLCAFAAWIIYFSLRASAPTRFEIVWLIICVLGLLFMSTTILVRALYSKARRDLDRMKR